MSTGGFPRTKPCHTPTDTRTTNTTTHHIMPVSFFIKTVSLVMSVMSVIFLRPHYFRFNINL